MCIICIKDVVSIDSITFVLISCYDYDAQTSAVSLFSRQPPNLKAKLYEPLFARMIGRHGVAGYPGERIGRLDTPRDRLERPICGYDISRSNLSLIQFQRQSVEIFKK